MSNKPRPPLANLGNDDTGANILHLDMDAFFASVEIRDNPDLAGIPVAVGSVTNRSVVSAASYEARKFGVHSAMPMQQALRICPNLVAVPPRHKRYREVSKQVMDILHQTTPVVEKISVDEAFLDVSGVIKIFGSPIRIANFLQTQVKNTLQLPCSIGIAGSKHVAKIASGMAKPNGIFIVPVKKTREFLTPLPITVLWGVGSKTANKLRNTGIFTVGDLASEPESRLRKILGDAIGEHLYLLANGIDHREVTSEHVEKSISQEVTFAENVTNKQTLHDAIVSQSHNIASRLRKAELLATTISLKVRFANFTTISRSQSLLCATNVGKSIAETALSLLDSISIPTSGVRLLGVKTSNIQSQTEGMLFELSDEGKRHTAEVTVDILKQKFSIPIGPGSVIKPELKNRLPRSSDR